MATLDALQQALIEKAEATASSLKQPLSDTQYSTGFDILLRGSGWTTYQGFIVPRLSQLLAPLFSSRIHISVLEIGPGPKSVLGHLPERLRRKVRKYTAYEPNGLFASKLENWLSSSAKTATPLPCLGEPPVINRESFTLQEDAENGTSTATTFNEEIYDTILFCHSMYGMKSKLRYIERALEMLMEQPQGGMVVVFHREGSLQLDGLVCHQTASFPDGIVRVADDDEVLDSFAAFVAGFAVQNGDVEKAVRVGWREVCRTLGRREYAHPGHLLFRSPDIMLAFTKHANALPELLAQVPLAKTENSIKNRQVRLHHSASTVRPTEVRHVQECVRWALEHGVGLAVVGGGHSDHCVQPNVVSVDMSAFDRIHIMTANKKIRDSGPDSSSLVVVEAGCKTGDIVSKTMAAGLTVPLGARPSVGAGLWLQGGIGHLARLHGLACDSIIGAVLVSVNNSQILCVGSVPSQHQPLGAARPENESDILWAMRGAGTNFGIVISVTFKSYSAPSYTVRNSVIPVTDNLKARHELSEFGQFARDLSWNRSADAFLY